MMMGVLWEQVDNTIDSFVSESKNSNSLEKSSILWKSNTLYAVTHCRETTHVLRGSKTIVSVPSLDAAKSLEDALRKRLAASDLLVKDQKTKKLRPFKLGIKIIQCLYGCGQLTLRKSNIPVTLHNLSCDKVCKIIAAFRQKELAGVDRQRAMYGSNIPDDVAKSFNNDVAKITEEYEEIIYDTKLMLNENDMYCVNFNKPYTMSYRITYNDLTSFGRKQTTVGDVLIAVRGTSVVNDERFTKTRADTFSRKNRSYFVGDIARTGIAVYKEMNKLNK